MSEPKKSMHRLKRWIGKEAARCRDIEESTWKRGDYEGRSRAFGEANVLTMVMGKIDQILKETN